ncbi:hypothetical protein PIB30_098696 [Stylosanthes scabra]|uniref:F-box domain-containing protein n=1 Tax=Stylosanthes scabra TaxID=79078 RepID=A0ABU6YW68_9FABA|nr:hypothetical protein [Stylosanthes scabra]
MLKVYYIAGRIQMESLDENMATFNFTINDNIPEHLILKILSKLPVKSLKRFQCVRKSWNTLLDDPSFIKMYYENLMPKSENFDSCILLKQEIPDTKQHNIFLLSGKRYEDKTKLDLPPPIQDKNEGFQVLGSSVNGTICLSPYGEIVSGNVVFWNPTTDEFKDIPLDPLMINGYDVTFSCIGFGYDTLRDDYILIRTGDYVSKGESVDEEQSYLPSNCDPCSIFEIYYPNGHCRRVISPDGYPEFHPYSETEFGIYLNGICHWRWLLSDHPYGDESAYKPYTFFDTLFSLDVGNNKLITTLICEDGDDDDIYRQLVVLSDRYLATISMESKTKCIDISILGEVGVNESWVKLFTIGPLSSIENVMGIGIHGDILLRKNDDELVSFDLGTQEIQDIGIKALGRSQTIIYEKKFQPIERKTN